MSAAALASDGGNQDRRRSIFEGDALFNLAEVLIAVALLLHAFRRCCTVADLSELDSIRSVDMAAFRNLIDSTENKYLMECLTKSQFRKVQRLRLRAALDYVDRTKHNCTVLLYLGKSACCDRDAKVSAAALDVVSSARRLWINTLLTTGAIYAEIVLPEAKICIERVVDIYEDFTNRVVRLMQLQDSTILSDVDQPMSDWVG